MFENAYVINAGKFTSRGAWVHPTTTISTTEIIVNTEGRWSMREGERQYEVAPGCVLILEPGVEHGGILPTEERVTFYWIHVGRQCPILPELERFFSLREPLQTALLCQQILYYMEMGFPDDVRDSLLHVLLAELMSQCHTDSGESALAWRIREWVRINADRAVTVPETAEHFGYNDDYVSRLLRRYYGKGVKAIISEYKLNRIKYLLLESNKTLAEIADETGFSDYKLFLKFFRYHAGCTPSEFRQVYYAGHTNNR